MSKAYGLIAEEDWNNLQAIETEACHALNNIIAEDCSGEAKWVETNPTSPMKMTSWVSLIRRCIEC